MDIRLGKVFGAGFMLATLTAPFAAFSQDVSADDARSQAAEIDALEPGFDTSAAEFDARADASAEGLNDPARPTAVLAQNDGGGRNRAVIDTIELSATEITGNQELPTVLVIVPWQKAEPGDLVGKPVNTLLDEVLAPIDREEFVRRVDYYGDVYGDNEE